MVEQNNAPGPETTTSPLGIMSAKTRNMGIGVVASQEIKSPNKPSNAGMNHQVSEAELMTRKQASMQSQAQEAA